MKCNTCKDKGYIYGIKVGERQKEGFHLPITRIAFKIPCLCRVYEEMREYDNKKR